MTRLSDLLVEVSIDLDEKYKTKGSLGKWLRQKWVDISCIIGVNGPLLGDKFYNQQTVFADRMTLYARDQHLLQ